ncbi:MAG TPA: hypothetical protein VJY39_05510 [Acidisphaera sp.]|nr:hypothetical protein [Acidisphaera sp.]
MSDKPVPNDAPAPTPAFDMAQLDEIPEFFAPFGEDPDDPVTAAFFAQVDFELSLGSGSTEQPLDALRAELEKLEKTLSPDLMEDLESWRQDVLDAVEGGDLGGAKAALQSLREEIPDATARVERQQNADAVFTGYFNFIFSDTHAVKAMSGVDLKDLWSRAKLADHLSTDVDSNGDLDPGSLEDPRVEKFREQFLRTFKANCTSLPLLAPVKTPECSFTCSKPVITLKQPEVTAHQSRREGGPTNYGMRSGNIGVHVTVTIAGDSSASDIDGWEACLLQNCRANRSVTYTNGASYTKIFATMADIVPVWVALSPGEPVPLRLTDAPKWQWTDELGTIDKVAIDDTHIVYLLVRKNAEMHCLMTLTWSFTSDGSGASYAVTKLTTSLVAGDGGANLATGPLANEEVEVTTPGTATQ